MTEQQACTLCGAGGHTAAQCNWNDRRLTFTLESLTEALGNVVCLHELGVELIAANVFRQHPKQEDGAQGERQAFEAHESRERRLSPADQKFWFRRGAVADYDIKSIDDAWKAWKARAALAQPALQCKKCGGTGDADSGGIHPWGEAAMVPCDCAHTERAQGKRTEDGDTIIDRLRLGGLTIDGDNAYKRDLLDCVVGALAFGFQGRPAPEETHWLHRFWEIGNAEREARAALAQPSQAPEAVYAVFADNGNIRCWAMDRNHGSLKELEIEGCTVVPLQSVAVAQAGQVPEGWRVMRCTSSIQREGDKWEIYDPQGSGGVVSTHDVKDWAVRGLLDALAAAPQPAGGE